MKKLMALILVCSLLLTAVVLTSCGNKISEGLEFQINEDNASYSLVGMGTCTDTDVVIPSEYNGLPVTAIGDQAMKRQKALVSITIPSSVKTIGERSFYGCENLTAFTIEGTDVTIGAEAFRGCVRLVNVTLSEGVVSVGDQAFAYCTKLEQFSFPKSVKTIGAMIFAQCKNIPTVVYSGTKAEWKEVSLDKTWKQTSSITRVFCSDGAFSF